MNDEHALQQIADDSYRDAREAMAAMKLITDQAKADGNGLTDDVILQIQQHKKIWDEAMERYVGAVRELTNL